MSDVATKDFFAAMAMVVRERCTLRPKLALLLGTGLGGVASAIQPTATIPYRDLPGMPLPTAASHCGELILGHLAGMPVAAFSGRLHCYEGHSPQEVVTPVRLGRELGAEILVMGSAVGGLNPRFSRGDVVLIDDHINLMGVNPLLGPNDEGLGPRWPDMFSTYDPTLIALARQVAADEGLPLHAGTYVGVLGPNLETRAEYRMLQRLGADMVGMSTVPEAIAAVHCGLRTLAFAIVTDLCLPDSLEPADINCIIAAANAAEPALSRVIAGVVRRLPKG